MREREDFFRAALVASLPPGLARRAIGKVRITSGQMCAMDPLTIAYERPFVRTIPKGTYGVHVLTLTDDNGDTIPALAWMEVSAALPTLFEPALRDNEEPSELRSGEFFGYRSDSATGAFLDAECVKRLVAMEDECGDRWDAWTDSVSDALDENTWGIAKLGRSRIPVFQAGYGSGTYPSYFGLDASGGIACVLTDLWVLDHVNYPSLRRKAHVPHSLTS